MYHIKKDPLMPIFHRNVKKIDKKNVFALLGFSSRTENRRFSIRILAKIMSSLCAVAKLVVEEKKRLVPKRRLARRSRRPADN